MLHSRSLLGVEAFWGFRFFTCKTKVLGYRKSQRLHSFSGQTVAGRVLCYWFLPAFSRVRPLFRGARDLCLQFLEVDRWSETIRALLRSWNESNHSFIHSFNQSFAKHQVIPLQYSCRENPMDGGAWWAAIHGVAKSQTWLTSLSLFTFMHWRRKWQPTPVFLPGESQGQKSLVGCHLWGCTELNRTDRT